MKKLVSIFIRQREGLIAEREKLTTDIDARIRAVETKLAALFGGTNTPKNGHATLPHPRPGSMKEKSLNLLRAKPDIGSTAMALALYEEDDEAAKNRVRSLVHVLRGDGLLKGEWGAWEVIGG